MRFVHSRSCEATSSSNVGVILSSRVKEILILTPDDVHTPSCHVEGTTSTYQVGDIPSFASYFQGTSSSVQGTKTLNLMLMLKMLRGWKIL